MHSTPTPTKTLHPRISKEVEFWGAIMGGLGVAPLLKQGRGVTRSDHLQTRPGPVEIPSLTDEQVNLRNTSYPRRHHKGCPMEDEGVAT